MSARPKTTPMSCSTVSSVLPTVTSRISSTKRVVSLLLMPAVGSSSRTTLGAAGDRDADLERALLGVGEVHRQRVALALEADHRHQLLGAIVGVLQVGEELPERVAVAERPEQRRSAGSRTPTGAPKMLVIWKLRARPRRLISYGLQAVDALAVEQDLAAGRPEAAADEIEERRLAGAVRADDRDALARRDGEVGAADDLGLAEATCAGPSARRAGTLMARHVAPRRCFAAS